MFFKLKNNIEIVKLLFHYANKNNIDIEIIIHWGLSVSRATCNNNIDIVKLPIEYANKNNIELIINLQINNGSYPLLWAVTNNNIDIINLIIIIQIKLILFWI